MGKFFKKHKKLVIVLAVILALVIILFVRANKKVKQLPYVPTTTVEKGKLVNTVNTTGTVESEKTKKVYTELTLPVDKNLVEVGDHVKEGDVLCELDTKTLEKRLEEQRASAGASSAINNNQIELAKKQYENAQKDLEEEQNTQLFQAEQAVIQAELNLEQAESSLDRSIETLQHQRSYLRDDYEGPYEDHKSIVTDPYVTDRDRAYSQYEIAQQRLKEAEEALELAKHGVDRQLESYEDSIATSQVAASSSYAQWVAIGNLEKDLEDAVVKSPVTGVVTGVYVTEGATATGLLYVIEDIDTLKITTSLKEYDLSFIEKGDKVEIKSDATGEEIFDGKVNLISPATMKDAKGDTIKGKNGEFETTIKVDSKKTGLLIGTKARMDIIYEEKENALSVGFEAVGVDENQQPVVFVIEEEVKDLFKLRAVPVTLGMETDFRVEVASGDIKEGDIILADATGAVDGSYIQIMPGNPVPGAAATPTENVE